MNQQLQSGTIYVQNYVRDRSGSLYTLDIKTGNATSVSSLKGEIYDIEAVGQSLYGLKKKEFGFRKTMKLLKIEPTSGQFEEVGDTLFDVVGLAYNPVDKKLYATAHRNSKIVEIDLTTGKGTPVVTLSDRTRQCGELAFNAEGVAYISLIGTDLKKYLATCDFTTGNVSIIGDIGFPGLASMKFIDHGLYGVAGQYEGLGGSNGQVIRIDTTTGKGRLITTTTPASCWAGLAVVTPVASSSQTSGIGKQGKQGKQIRADNPPSTLVSKKVNTTTEQTMTLLTIDTKTNCYVIEPTEMDRLQKNIASSFTLKKGIFDIQITDGKYSYSKSKAEGEPLVVLWIYGLDGSTFINRNTGVEIGTTWTTLNGYDDRLQIESNGQTVVCALFFDIKNQNNPGTVQVSITGNNSKSKQKKLTVDGRNNCYILNENHLKGLQKWNANFVELEPGNYLFKIRESTASYWSENQNFQLEPWALLWIKVGKFIPKQTGIEVEETWCSLNGLQDELVLEVKEKTTIAGYFFDTFKDDNEGQIILEILAVGEGGITQERTGNSAAANGSGSDGSGSDSGGFNGSGSEDRGDRSRQYVTAISGGGGTSEEINFTFSFDDSQVEKAWEKIAAKVEAAVTVTDEQDATVEARRWDQLENWLLTGYKTQTKDLAMQVARLELMMNTFKQQLDSNLQLTFKRWSNHFDGRLQSFVGTQIADVTQGSITVAIEQLKLDLFNQTSRLIQTEINNAKTEINQAVSTEISTVRTELNRAIETQVCNVKNELNQAIETNAVSTKTDLNQTLETQISEAKTEIGKTIETIIANVKTEISNDIDTRLTNVKTEVNQTITDVNKTINVTDVVSNEISNQITETIKTDIQKDIDIKVENARTSIVSAFEKTINTQIDTRLTDVQTNINTLEKNIDTKLDTLRVDFRGEVVTAILEQISNLIEEKTKLEIAKVDFNTYLAQIDARATKYLQQLSQLEVTLIARINEGDTHLYNWVLEQLMTLKGCLADRQVLVDQLALFSNELKTRLDTAPCVNPAVFKPWTPLPFESQVLPGRDTPQLSANS
ncbi:MAG: hypothetical protein AAGD25_29685 [Cyanobacteria bacterium P01_F01_bin.150]